MFQLRQLRTVPGIGESMFQLRQLRTVPGRGESMFQLRHDGNTLLFGTAWSKCSSCMGTLYCFRQRGVIVSFAVTQHCPGQCGVNDLCPVTGSMEQCDLVLTSMEMICVLFRTALSHGLTGISLRI